MVNPGLGGAFGPFKPESEDVPTAFAVFGSMGPLF